MAAASGILQRFGARERKVAGVVVLVAVVAGALVGYQYMGDQVAQLEESLALGQEAIEEIQASAREFLDSQRRKEMLETAIKANDPKIQTAIDAVARKVRVLRMDGEKGEETTFDKVLRYDAKTTERGISLGEQSKKKKREASDFVELSQPVEYTFVKFADLIYFLEQIESPERLMYVSKLVLTQKYLDPEYVQGKLTISTFVHKPQKEEEETSEE